MEQLRLFIAEDEAIILSNFKMQCQRLGPAERRVGPARGGGPGGGRAPPATATPLSGRFCVCTRIWCSSTSTCPGKTASKSWSM